MLTIEQIKAGKSDYGRWSFIVIGSAFLAWVLGMAIAVSLLPPTRVAKVDDWYLLCGFIPGAVILLGGICILERKTRRDVRVCCPTCNKQLINISTLVIATRNCGFCGHRVLLEPDGPATESKQSLDDVSQRLK